MTYRDTEYVLASSLVAPQDHRWEGVDELPGGRGKITKVLNDSGVLYIHTEHAGVVVRHMNAPIERYVR